MQTFNEIQSLNQQKDRILSWLSNPHFRLAEVNSSKVPRLTNSSLKVELQPVKHS